MVALYLHSSYLSSTTGWQAEDKKSHLLNYEEPFASHTPKETDASYQSLGLSPTQPEFELDDPQNSTLSIKNSSNSTRKSCHNANERDRRKKLNNLYSSLRSLLPEMDQSQKKLSIPSTVSRVLKYIPELQEQVEKLTWRKEEILLMVLRQAEHVHTSEGMVYPIVSATCLNNREVMLQICFLDKAVRIPLSKILRVLEGEGLQLMNGSTSTTHDDKTFYSLHLQARESISVEFQIFCEHLIKVIREQARLGFSIRRFVK